MAVRHQPLQPLEVTFTAGLDGFRMLSAMQANKEKGYVEFKDDLLALAVLSHQSWFNATRKLTMYFKGGLIWNEADFLKLASNGIESIRVASDSPLNALQSGRSKKREEACTSIASAVLTPEFVDELTAWGLTVHCSVIGAEDGLYMMSFDVRNGNADAYSFLLDGWSGNILTPNMNVISFCPSLATVRGYFKRTLTEYLEAATTTS